MNENPLSAAISNALQILRHAGVMARIESRLIPLAEQTSHQILDCILDEVPAYSTSANPDILPALRSHIDEHVTTLAKLVSARSDTDLDFVRQHASRSAEQKFPLDAVLASYRCLHKIVAVWIRDTALQSADETAQMRRVVAAASEFTAEYIGAISTIMTSDYVAETRALAEAEGDQRNELFTLLLSGYDESDSRAAQLLRRTGYLEQRQSFCVVVAQSVNAVEMENAARAQRMADAVADSLRDLPIRVLVGVRNNLVTVIVSATRRQSGWTTPQSLLADRMVLPLRAVGPAALIGMSSDAPSTSHIPGALREARLALDCASVADRVMPYARIPFRDMLIKVAAEELRGAVPAWVSDFTAANEKSRGTLITTLKAYAEADMNVLKTAKTLSIHPNTIYARMQRINDITGLNPLSYNALTELLLAMDCVLVAE